MNKYQYLYVIQGNYGMGWEDLTYEDTRRDAKRMLRDYDVNETQYPHRMIQRRVLNGSGEE